MSRVVTLDRAQSVVVTVAAIKTCAVPRCRFNGTLVVTVRCCTRTRNIVTSRYAVTHVDKVYRRTIVVIASVNSVTVRSVVTVTRITRRLVTKVGAVVVVGTARSGRPLAASVT